MKIILISLASLSILVSCTQTTNNAKKDNQKVYSITIYEDKYDEAAGKMKPNNAVGTITNANDTTAYLEALKDFNNQKLMEEKNPDKGKVKSFVITDKNGVDLEKKLSADITQKLKQLFDRNSVVRQ